MSTRGQGDTGEQGIAGEQGVTGERGDSGDRGVSGERGPKGDHGQHGDVGLTGKIGERGDTGGKGERGDTGEKGEPGESTRLSRNVSVWWIVLAVVIAAVLFAFSYVILQNRGLIDRLDRQQVQLDMEQKQIAELARTTTESLCQVRGNRQRSLERQKEYLRQVRNGEREPIEGITEADILQSIASEKQTIEDLSNLECPPPK